MIHILNSSYGKANGEILFSPGKEIDHILVDLNFRHVLNRYGSPYYFYLSNPNKFKFVLDYAQYRKSEATLLRPFYNTSAFYTYRKGRHSATISQQLKRVKGLDVFFKSSLSTRPLDQNARERLTKRSISFVHQFSDKPPTEIFSDHFYFDAPNHFYLRLSSKQRANDVDFNHASKDFLERSLNNTHMLSTKVGFKLNLCDIGRTDDVTTFRVSCEALSD